MKENIHWLISIGLTGDWMATRYSSRRTAVRGAYRTSLVSHWEHFVVEDCGDHWGLWAGYKNGCEASLHVLNATAPSLAYILPEEGFRDD